MGWGVAVTGSKKYKIDGSYGYNCSECKVVY